MTYETPHLQCDDDDYVWIRAVEDSLIPLGWIEDCDEECPSALLAELDTLRGMVRGYRPWNLPYRAAWRSDGRQAQSAGDPALE